MQQTLLAVAAVAAFAYLALGSQRSDHALEQRGTTAAVEIAAVDLARDRMDVLMGMAFDEGDVETGALRGTPSPHTIGPDAGEGGASTYDDLDDWNGYDEAATAAVGRGTLPFRERVTVRYVLDDVPAAPSADATLTKEVIVTIEQVVGGAATGRPAQASLRRVITPVALAIDHATR